MRLPWQSKIVSGSTTTPAVALSQSANCTFAARFAARNSSRNIGSAASGRSARRWAWAVGRVAWLVGGGWRGGGGAGEPQPSTCGHTVGLVVEALGKDLREVSH